MKRLSPRSTTGQRRSIGRWLLLVAGLSLLITAFTFSVAANRRSAADARDTRLAQHVAIQAQLLREYFERARSVILLSAQNPAFREFYLAPGTRADTLAAGGPLVHDVSSALAYLETLYPGPVLSEVCFIDQSGAENARVVGSHLARADELSADESGASFFAPSLALAPGVVYQAAPYVSPDTKQWVISNSTVLPDTGDERAILHFEISLESFRAELSAGVDGHTKVVDGMTGAVVLDIERQQAVPGATTMRELIGVGADHGLFDADGNRVAYQRVPARVGNANHWYVVSTTPLDTGLSEVLGLGPGLLLLSALFLLMFAVLSWRSHTARLAHAAVTDSLTGLPNRLLFHDRVAQGLRFAERKGTVTALAIVDLDRFKAVNDSLGHHRGDLLLKEVAERLRGAVRHSDTVARLGGDEFAIFLPEIGDSDGADVAAARIHAALIEPYLLAGQLVTVGASLGVTVYPRDGVVPEQLIQRADMAMYQAKRNSSGVVVYHAELVDDTEAAAMLLPVAAADPAPAR